MQVGDCVECVGEVHGSLNTCSLASVSCISVQNDDAQHFMAPWTYEKSREAAITQLLDVATGGQDESGNRIHMISNSEMNVSSVRVPFVMKCMFHDKGEDQSILVLLQSLLLMYAESSVESLWQIGWQQHTICSSGSVYTVCTVLYFHALWCTLMIPCHHAGGYYAPGLVTDPYVSLGFSRIEAADYTAKQLASKISGQGMV